MKKGLIALMLATTLTATALTGCSDGRDSTELESEQDVELVKSLTENFDPIEVINPEGDKTLAD